MLGNIKEKIEEIVGKLRSDKNLMQKFQTNPAGLVKEYVGIDLPEEQVNQVVETIKAKLTAENLGNMLGGLFGRK